MLRIAYATADPQFARLRSPSQFATVQLLSSISVVIIFPLQMTKAWFRMLQILVGYPQPYEDHVDNVAASFYVRGLAQNVTMVGFLGEWARAGMLEKREGRDGAWMEAVPSGMLPYEPGARYRYEPDSKRVKNFRLTNQVGCLYSTSAPTLVSEQDVTLLANVRNACELTPRDIPLFPLLAHA